MRRESKPWRSPTWFFRAFRKGAALVQRTCGAPQQASSRFSYVSLLSVALTRRSVSLQFAADAKVG